MAAGEFPYAIEHEAHGAKGAFFIQKDAEDLVKDS